VRVQGGFEAINAALSKVDRKQVKGIGISGQQHGFVPVDKKGKASCSFLPQHCFVPPMQLDPCPVRGKDRGWNFRN